MSNRKKLVIGVIGADVHAVGIKILHHAFEDAGFEVTSDSLKETWEMPIIHGIAETMDFPRVLSQEPELMNILAFGRSNEILIDGHLIFQVFRIKCIGNCCACRNHWKYTIVLIDNTVK